MILSSSLIVEIMEPVGTTAFAKTKVFSRAAIITAAIIGIRKSIVSFNLFGFFFSSSGSSAGVTALGTASSCSSPSISICFVMLASGLISMLNCLEPQLGQTSQSPSFISVSQPHLLQIIYLPASFLICFFLRFNISASVII